MPALPSSWAPKEDYLLVRLGHSGSCSGIGGVRRNYSNMDGALRFVHVARSISLRMPYPEG